MADGADQLSLVAEGFSFPTSLTFDDTGRLYVAESGLAFDGPAPGGRVWRIDPAGGRSMLAEGLRAPVNGLVFHDGALYISEGGHPGRISRLDPSTAQRTTILDGLPGPGNYHTNMVAFGPDGRLYFSQGAMSNTGIIGLDAYALGWLRRLPHAHDVPGYDVVLAGVNVETDGLPGTTGPRVQTGAFVPFGTRTSPGQRVQGRLPCTAGIMRCAADGSDLELVAWGLRNAYGLRFLSDGRLLVTEQGPDDRGSRPIGNAPDLLFGISPGAWYGWPDFIGGDPVTNPAFRSERGPAASFVLADHDKLPRPERPLVRFPPHSAPLKFDVAPNGTGVYEDQIFVALFGDERPMTAAPGPRMGRAVVRIDPADWTLHAFIGEPLIRPIDLGFDPTERALYVLDFGRFEMTAGHGVIADATGGCVWKIPSKALRQRGAED